MAAADIGTVGALALSVVSSVSIVICNKALLTNFGYTFGTTLTSWHLLVTFLSLHVARTLGLFEPKPLDAWLVVGFGVLNGTSVGLLNLCLAFNSVGFYQMSKLAIIPCTVLLQTLFLGMRFSAQVQLSLLLLLAGVGIATVTDLELNLVGTVLAMLAIVTTCVGQILTHFIQKTHFVSSTELLYQSSPFQAAVLLFSGPFVDYSLTGLSVLSFSYTAPVLALVATSCLIAVAVNLSTFMVIGKTSPVTFQVLGHLKTCLVLTFGFTVLHNPFHWKNLAGIVVAMGGMVLYSYFQIQEGREREREQAASLPVKQQDADGGQAAAGESELQGLLKEDPSQ